MIRWRSRPAVAAAVALASAVPYAGTLGHGFVLDDNAEVVDNAYIRSLGELPRVWMSPSWAGAGRPQAGIYRPLTTSTFSINHALGGLAPAGYHLVNVVLHAIAAALVVALGIQLGLPLGAAALAGLLFGLHPVHVEAVANVAGRKDVLATVFTLASVLAHGAALRRGGPAVVLAPLALAAAFLSKETGVAVVGIVAARDLLFGREEWRRARFRGIALYAAYLGLAGAYLWVRWRVVGGFAFTDVGFEENPLAFAPPGVRLLTAVAVLGKGLLLLLLPIHLSPDYSYRAIPLASSLGDPRVLIAVAAILGLAALAVLLRRSWTIGLLSFLWYGIGILPASNLLLPVGTIFGERLLYLPSAGFCLALGEAVALLTRTRAAAVVRAASAAVLLACAAGTWAYARIWSDQASLFSSAVRTQPGSSRAHRLLGGALMEQGRAEEAVAEFERAVEILRDAPAPRTVSSRPRLELAVAYDRLGRLRESEETVLAVLRDDPGSADALWRLGVIRWKLGNVREAVDLWRRAIAADPRHAPAMSDLGIAYLAAGDTAAAKAMWLRSAATDPTLAIVWFRLGELYEQEGDAGRAREARLEFLKRANGRYPEMRAQVTARLGLAPATR